MYIHTKNKTSKHASSEHDMCWLKNQMVLLCAMKRWQVSENLPTKPKDGKGTVLIKVMTLWNLGKVPFLSGHCPSCQRSWLMSSTKSTFMSPCILTSSSLVQKEAMGTLNARGWVDMFVAPPSFSRYSRSYY